jgi:hypothetical protein
MNPKSLLIPALLLAACGTKMVPVEPATVLLHQPQAGDAVRAAIIRGVTRHKLSPDSESPGRIVATYDRRGVMYRLAFEYTDRQYTIRYLETRGLETAMTGHGLLIDARYLRMVRRLEHAINEELERPAKEAAAARERQRQHQLAVEAERRRAEEAAWRREEARRRRHHHRHHGPPPPRVVVQPPAPAPGGVHIQHRTVHKSGSQSLTCCINGARYRCPSQQAFEQCMTMNPSACTPAGTCK